MMSMHQNGTTFSKLETQVESGLPLTSGVGSLIRVLNGKCDDLGPR
jgi:hypothetical protein